MGNSLTREHGLSEQSICIGSSGLWRLYRSHTKKSAIIFVFDKQTACQLATRHGPALARADVDAVTVLMRRQVQQLAKWKHPGIVSLVYPLSESSGTLAFGTESIVGTLADYISNNAVDSLDILRGVQQLAETLLFLHQAAKVAYGSLSLDNILVNERGDWLLLGSAFTQSLDSSQSNSNFVRFTDEKSMYLQPLLDYLAPECVWRGQPPTAASDMFALGCVIYALFNNGKAPLSCQHNSWVYKQQSPSLQDPIRYLNCISFQDALPVMLAAEPTQRPNLDSFLKSTLFSQPVLQTVRFLEQIVMASPLEKARFLQQLLMDMPSYPKSLVVKKILPCLLAELKDTLLVPFLLPCLFWIVKEDQLVSTVQVREQILPALEQPLHQRRPTEILVVALQPETGIDVLIPHITPHHVQNLLIPLLFNALEIGIPDLQCRALFLTPRIVILGARSLIGEQVFPRIIKLIQLTTVIPVQIAAVQCLAALIPHLDVKLLEEQLLTAVNSKPPSSETSKAWMDLFFAIIQSKKISASLLLQKWIPPLWQTLAYATTVSDSNLSREECRQLAKQVLDECRQLLTLLDQEIWSNRVETKMLRSSSSQILFIPGDEAFQSLKQQLYSTQTASTVPTTPISQLAASPSGVLEPSKPKAMTMRQAPSFDPFSNQFRTESALQYATTGGQSALEQANQAKSQAKARAFDINKTFDPLL